MKKTSQRKHNKLLAFLFLVGLPTCIVLVFAFHDTIGEWAQKFPQCIIYSRYNLYCPSCGNTRSVISLLRGDILAALRFNITPSLMILIVTAFYCEVLMWLFGKRIVIVPRKVSFLVCLLIGLFIYYVARNYV